MYIFTLRLEESVGGAAGAAGALNAGENSLRWRLEGKHAPSI